MKQKKGNSTQQQPLRKWLIGDATRHDERSLDAQAQDDPFLADAIEGYRTLPGCDHAADVTKLKARLRQKTERDRGAGFYLLRIAAVGAVLVAAWIVLQQFQSSDKSAEVADNMQPAAESASPAPATMLMDSTVADIAQAETEEKIAPKGKAANHPDFARDQAAPTQNTVTNFDQSVAAYKTEDADEAAGPPPVTLMESKPSPPKPTEDAVAMEAPKAAAKENVNADKATTSLPEAKKKMDASARASKPASTRTITGKVSDENGDPIIGATIQVANSGIGTATDVDGSYTLTLPNGMESLVFSSTGYVQLQITVGSSDRLNVQLTNNDMALSEVVVSDYSQADDANQEVITPRPVGGFKKFRQYVASNMHHPEGSKQPRPKETVRIRFKINKDGSLSDFSSKSKVPQAYKDEAIRLLNEGPRWESTTDTTASYRFVFE